MEYFIATVDISRYHSYDSRESTDYSTTHLVKADSEQEAVEKVKKHYKSKSEPYGGYVYRVNNVEIGEVIS